MRGRLRRKENAEKRKTVSSSTFQAAVVSKDAIQCLLRVARLIGQTSRPRNGLGGKQNRARDKTGQGSYKDQQESRDSTDERRKEKH